MIKEQTVKNIPGSFLPSRTDAAIMVARGQGKMHNLIAPIDCVELAILRLINGEIINCHYDGDTEQVVERE